MEGVERPGNDVPHGSFVTSSKPFYFSVDVPEGNYDVTVTLGDAQGESTTTVLAETRRPAVIGLSTDKGKFATRPSRRTFTIRSFRAVSKSVSPTESERADRTAACSCTSTAIS